MMLERRILRALMAVLLAGTAFGDEIPNGDRASDTQGPPGSKDEVVAKNRIESLAFGADHGAGLDLAGKNKDVLHQECTVSCPVFDGNRISYQAEETLYCIGKGKSRTPTKDD